MARVLMVIAPENFRDEELFHTKEEIEKAGHKTFVVSTTTKAAKGSKGGLFTPQGLLDEVNMADFDAVVFVGGVGATVYFKNETALNLAREFYVAGKVTSAICIAPTVLANAGVLKGKKATAWESQEDNLKANGANWQKLGVVADGKVVTGAGPDYAREFGQKIVALLKKKE